MKLARTAVPLRFSEDLDGRLVAREGAFELVLERLAPGWVLGYLLIWDSDAHSSVVKDVCCLGMGSLEQIEEHCRQVLRDGGVPGLWNEEWRDETLAGRPWVGHRRQFLTAV